MGKEDPCRLFVDAARGMARRGAPWRQLSTRYGQSGTGLPPLGRLVRPGAPDGLPAGRAGSVRRAVGQHDRARARERGGRTQNQGTDPALGRSRGGFGTQIHRLADRRGRPLHLRLTGGQRHDRTQALGKLGRARSCPA